MTRKPTHLFLATLLCCLYALAAHAENSSEFLLFLSADDLERQSTNNAAVPTSDFTPTIDLLYSYNNGAWRVLGEYYLTDDENELERMQVGYEFREDDMIWLGRFHQPLNVWNTAYHHGAYLQPSISRPSIENWEDENGVMVSHVTGAMLDTGWPIRDSSGVRMALAVGFAPIIVDGTLEPFDFLDPDDGASRPAGSISISYYPDYVGESNFGLIGGYSEIEVRPDPNLGNITDIEIIQKVFGAQVNWAADNWQLLGAAYYVDNKSHGSAIEVSGYFAAGYLQASFDVGTNLDIYGRLEHTDNPETSYLQLFPYFVSERQIAGLRWEFAKRQALYLEISANSIVGDSFSEFRVQWAAVIP